jgi:predicted O-methyltransferase YrrM
MNDARWSAVDSYVNALFSPNDEALTSALEASVTAGLPQIQVSPAFGKLLYLLARSQTAENILELGTLGGYSTIWLARALSNCGKLVTLEAEPAHAQVAAANIARAGLSHLVELCLGPAINTLPELVQTGRGPFDFIFLDADKESYPDYLPWLLRLSRAGTIIIADNVVRNGGVIDDKSDDPRIRGVRRFNELFANESRISATILQTVGSKGYDGFAFGLVIADP